MGRDALRAVTSADVAALLPGGGGAGTRVFTAVCVAPGGDRFYLGDDDGDIIACRVVRGADADGVIERERARGCRREHRGRRHSQPRAL